MKTHFRNQILRQQIRGKKCCPLAWRNMKMFVCFSLLMGGMNVTAESYAQTATVSIEMRNKTVKEILDDIERQSEFDFFYNNRVYIE